MRKKRKSASKSSPPTGVHGAKNGLEHALGPVATVLTEELAALLAAVLDGRKKKTLDRLSQALSQAMPELLQRAFNDQLLASGAATERRSALAARMGAGEMPEHRPSTGPTPVPAADENSDWMSAAAVAKLLDVSPASVKKLARAGKLGEVDANRSGIDRHERVAVLAYYNQTKRPNRT